MMPNSEDPATTKNDASSGGGEEGGGGGGGGSGGGSSSSSSSGALKKGPWTAAEDAILMEYVKKHGEGNWNAVQKNSGLSRCGKSCRLRWANHLRPNLKKGTFSPEEERLILELHAKLGNKWARMAAQLPGRTDNEIKNYWNTRVKRRQRAGLPLYPQEIQKKQASPYHLNQNNQNHQSSQSPPPAQHFSMPQQHHQKPNFGSSLSQIDPLNYPLAATPLQAHHPPPYMATPFYRFKAFRDNNSEGFSVPYSTSSPQQNPPPSSLFGQCPLFPLSPSLQLNSNNFDFNPPPQILGNLFETENCSPFSMKLELPSSQEPQPADTATAASGNNTNEFKIPSPMDRSGSGLLDALLVESNAIMGGDDSKRGGLLEEKCGLVSETPPSGLVFSDNATARPLASATRWDDSSSAPSSAGVKIKKDGIYDINSGDEDFRSLFDMLPSAVSVSEWYSDSGELSNGQSSGVTDEEMGLERQPLGSSMSVPKTTDPDWSWTTMPEIC